jgi:hypothetical protein
MKVAPVNPPEEFVFIVPPRVTADPANFATRAELPAKPEPDALTVEPILPLFGLREIEGVMANVEFAEFEVVSDALTFFPPAV